MPYCTECGYKVNETDVFCGKCGKKIERPPNSSEEFEKSLLNSRFNKLSNRERRLILFAFKSREELVNLADEYGISLTKRGLFRRREVKKKDEIIEILSEYDFDVDELLAEVTVGFNEFPISDARAETVKRFNLFLWDISPYGEEDDGSYADEYNYIIQNRNKLDAYLNPDSYFHTHKHREPYIIFPGINAFYLHNVLDSSEEIKVSKNIITTENLIKCLLVLGNRETKIYSEKGYIYLINDLGEAIFIGTSEKKRSKGLDLKQIIQEYRHEEYSGTYDTMWRDFIPDYIALIDEINLFDEFHSLESQKTEYATFPRDTDALIRAWRREIQDWQPAYIEYTKKEQEVWNRFRGLNNMDGEVSNLIDAVLVNLSYARCEREKSLDTFKAQLREMEAYREDGGLRHVDAVNEHLDAQLQWVKTRRRLRNDYSNILTRLVEARLPIPGRLVPEKIEINDEDYELSQYIIQRELTPIQRRIMERGYDPNYIPLITEYEEYRAGLKTRDEQDAIMDGLSETSRWYFDMMKKIK